MPNQVSQVITPGVCPPEGCPPPTRIECIAVDKVFDSCFQLENMTRDITVSTFTGPFTVGTVVSCAQNGTITCTTLAMTPVGGGFSNITVLVQVPLTLTNPNNMNQTFETMLTFIKTATLCCPEGVSPDCSESVVNFCNCVVTAVHDHTLTVTCTVQVCVVLKCILFVQLLVPSFGFCVPAPCTTLGGVCPPTPPAQCF